MQCGWGGNRGPGGKVTAANRKVYDLG